MGTFFFDLFDGTQSVKDDFGERCADAEAAADLATGLLVDLARERLPSGKAETFGVVVRDGADRDLFHGVLSFRGTVLDGTDPRSTGDTAPGPRPAGPSDLVRQSRELRARSRELARQHSLQLSEFGELLARMQDGLKTARAGLTAPA